MLDVENIISITKLFVGFDSQTLSKGDCESCEYHSGDLGQLLPFDRYVGDCYVHLR